MTAFLRRRALVAVGAVSLVAVGAGVVYSCGPYLTFRAYLRRTFWHPVRFASLSLADGAPRPTAVVAYAGLGTTSAPAPLKRLREAYRPLSGGEPDKDSVPDIRKAAAAADAALATGALTGAALEEARLIDAKIALRAMEADVGTPAEARRKLEALLARKPGAARASEARTWLARVYHREGDGVAAARIYLDELDAASPVVRPEVLASSLRIVFAAHEQQFWDRVEEFFDHPRHALFIVNLLTNPQGEFDTPVSRDTARKQGARILSLLRARKNRFAPGPDADALALAMMRVSLYSGDVPGALEDAAGIAASSPVRSGVEFNWMLGSACYLSGDFAKAEAPLRRILDDGPARASDCHAAAEALMAVYLKLGRRVEALHASLTSATCGDVFIDEAPGSYRERYPQWCASCDSLDLPYLLDAVLTPAELRAYLAEHGAGWTRTVDVSRDRKMTPPDVVRYSLAVREARAGAFAEAERLYLAVGAAPRAERMHTLAGLSARAQDESLPAADRLQARYDLAAYLADNPDRILFNDLFWRGFQRMALVGPDWDPKSDRESGLTAAEHREIVASDRKLRDEQEELWQAFLRLEDVVRDSGSSPLAHRAAVKIVDVLPRINTDRFGRAADVQAATKRWVAWLRTHPR